MKLVGGDSGRVEREEFIDEVLLSPSERVIVDVLFDRPGEVVLENRTPDRTYELGHITVEGEAAGEAAAAFDELRVDPELSAERERVQADIDREPDKTLAFVSEMPILYGSETSDASQYVCPMHPEVTASEQAACPKCGMKLIPADQVPGAGEGDRPRARGSRARARPRRRARMGRPDAGDQPPDQHDQHDLAAGRQGDGAENAGITWAFRVGDRVKIRLANEMDQEHPMHHPFHIHGAGRFLVLSRDGEPEGNFVWKDTVLLRAGQTIDILLGRHQPRPVDGSLPHRRTHRERDDVQLRRRAGGRRRVQLAREVDQPPLTCSRSRSIWRCCRLTSCSRRSPSAELSGAALAASRSPAARRR